MPETASSFEILRLIVSSVGILVCWRGRTSARDGRAAVPDGPVEVGDPYERASRVQRALRMDLVGLIQTILLWIHMGFATNAFVNMFYPSASLESLNVMSSNLLQILAPLGLIWVSTALTTQMRISTNIAHIVGPRPDPPEVPS